MHRSYYSEQLRLEATRIHEARAAGKPANYAAMQDVARARVAKKVERYASIVKLLYHARRATTFVACPWGYAPVAVVQPHN